LPNTLERDGKAIASVVELVEPASPVANPNPDQEEEPKEEKPVDVCVLPNVKVDEENPVPNEPEKAFFAEESCWNVSELEPTGPTALPTLALPFSPVLAKAFGCSSRPNPTLLLTRHFNGYCIICCLEIGVRGRLIGFFHRCFSLISFFQGNNSP
jgi:hypothetical protein